jgi:acetoin utilization deacetylase AcuC-like enzyme
VKAGYVYHPIYLKHDTGQHVERGGRLEAIISHLDETGLKQRLSPIQPRAATVEEISLVHRKQYIEELRRVGEEGGGWLDADTVMSPHSYEAAIYAVGGVIRAVEAVMDGEVGGAFALVRPPGHHATVARAMGFCLFNNVAVAAKYALNKYQLERIAVIDFDVHHGNSTHDIFYDDPQVLYISTHQYPFYPGTGAIEQTGDGAAEGATVNIPLPPGCGDDEYLQVFKQIIAPAVKRFNPQLILVSAGYDPHWADHLALMEVSTVGFADMVKIIKGLSDELCGGRLVFSLEGGYHLRALSSSVKATFDVLLGNDIEDPLGPSTGSRPPDIAPLIKAIKDIHRLP